MKKISDTAGYENKLIVALDLLEAAGDKVKMEMHEAGIPTPRAYILRSGTGNVHVSLNSSQRVFTWRGKRNLTYETTTWEGRHEVINEVGEHLKSKKCRTSPVTDDEMMDCYQFGVVEWEK